MWVNVDYMKAIVVEERDGFARQVIHNRAADNGGVERRVLNQPLFGFLFGI